MPLCRNWGGDGFCAPIPAHFAQNKQAVPANKRGALLNGSFFPQRGGIYVAAVSAGDSVNGKG
ncbi:MAG: hypothetical protein DU429_06960 [Candidatus Tokpelaia sp.]|nr:MAG: hypothetical protein DU429_06960 [Candidatus Tokpelaia sp.]KAA6206177.1 MAG: hypothetical protein DU430_02165 [Candidatus Tokpelaia sp.]KAA6406074.1 hypothetical protein DPQ22_01145 [Candidatus Tokpelaia sp.]